MGMWLSFQLRLQANAPGAGLSVVPASPVPSAARVGLTTSLARDLWLGAEPGRDAVVLLLPLDPVGEERLDDVVLASLGAGDELLLDQPGERVLERGVRRQLVALVVARRVRRAGWLLREREQEQPLRVRRVVPDLDQVVVL